MKGEGSGTVLGRLQTHSSCHPPCSGGGGTGRAGARGCGGVRAVRPLPPCPSAQEEDRNDYVEHIKQMQEHPVPFQREPVHAFAKMLPLANAFSMRGYAFAPSKQPCSCRCKSPHAHAP